MNKMNFLKCAAACAFLAMALVSCAGNRQGIVCDEIEYRLNTMTYSPDQRAYEEEELRVCREEEAKKRGEDAATRQSIYDRFAASDTTKSSAAVQPGAPADSAAARDVSVSEALQDSSGEKTTSIYDRYGAVGGPSAESASATAESVPATAETTAGPAPVSAGESAPDTSASDVTNFQ